MARPEPERSRATAIAGVLLAVGGALLGAARGAAGPAPARPGARPGTGAKAPEAPASPPARDGQGPAGRPGAPSRPKAARPNVRTKPRPPEEPPRTRYWPPPAPNPTEPSPDEVHAAEAEARDAEVPVDPRSEALGYEVADTSVAHLVKLMAIGATAIVGSIVGLFVFIGHSQRVDRSGPALTPLQLAVIVPPGPRLQDHPLADIAAEKLRETDRLASYAWADPSHSTARIPIARAQSLVIGRSLDPSPPDGAAAAAPFAAAP